LGKIQAELEKYIKSKNPITEQIRTDAAKHKKRANEIRREIQKMNSLPGRPGVSEGKPSSTKAHSSSGKSDGDPAEGDPADPNKVKKGLEEKIKKYNIIPLATAIAIKNESQLFNVVGLVTRLKKIVTKSGQPMVFATIEDLSGVPAEVIVFSTVFAKTTPTWVENNIIAVKGKMSWKNNEPKIICDNARVFEG
jgi:DNA polymerase III alpha subunit